MAHTIHPDTRLGYVHLTVTNLERALTFYRQVLGFKLHRRDGAAAFLGAGGSDLVALTENTKAQQTRGTTGLYHFAILVASRLEFAQSLRCIAEMDVPTQGFADHGVSESIYLPDPDGNGIEIYRDRPRSEWRDVNGQLQMGADPLDMDGVLAELEGHAAPWRGLDLATVLGHMHLQVANIRAAEAFYIGLLGFDLVLRLPSASFVSAGGYHHHIGFNAWVGAGAPPPPLDAVGLRYFVIHLPNDDELGKVTDRVRKAGLALRETSGGWLVRDPSQNGILLAAAARFPS